MDSRTVEVVVVGAGFAGLAAAQVLGRAQRDVLVLGSGPTRNAESAHAHNVLTRDGTAPAELLRLGRAEVAALPTVTLEESRVDAVEAHDAEGLRVRTGAGDGDGDGEEIDAEMVLLATGARDTLPAVPGLAGLWGRRAHSCPFCDGAGYAGRRLLVLADQVKGPHLGALLAGWTGQVRVVDPAAVEQLDEHGGDVTARLLDGEVVTADGVFVGVTPVPRLDCVGGLPLARRGPYLAVDGDGRTTHPRLRAAGDCAWRAGDAMPGGQVVAAMAAGSRAAFRIVFDRLGVAPPDPPPVETPRTAPDPDDERTTAQFWDDRYGQAERVWSGRPNQRLVDEFAGLTPGTALDLGCGEGADAVWLAEQGWQVVATDVSATALERGARAAAERGVDARIDWQRHDLATSFPEGAFDLVVAAYLLSPVAIPRGAILRSAAAAVRRGGHLVILGHRGLPPWAEPNPAVHFATFEEELATLDLPPLAWAVEVAEDYERLVTAPDGATGTRVDTILRLRRR